MANYAKITFQLGGISTADDYFNIRIINPDLGLNVVLSWMCKPLRTQSNTYTQATAGASEQMGNLFDAVQSDVSNTPYSQYFTFVVISSTEFDMEATSYGWTIEEVIVEPGTQVTITQTLEVLPTKDFQLTGYTIAAGIIPCSDVEVTIDETDGVAPFTWISPANASTSLVAQIARSAPGAISITLEDSEGDQATIENVFIPPLFTATYITGVSVVTNVGGLDATVTAFVDNPLSLFTFTYSLDGSNFQASNIFPNVLNGDYTLYVNDGYGCIATKAFSVDTATSVQRANAYAIVSKSNSIRYIQSGSHQYSTLENTHYQDQAHIGEDRPFYGQQYQTDDGIIKTRFRSNYDELSARLLDCKGNIVDTFSINKISDNTGAKDKRDCIAFNLGDNRTGIYFTSGNIYDPGTTDIIDTYELNGNVPEWGVVGNTMVLSGAFTGSFIIKQVIYDAVIQARALVIDQVWTGGSQSEAMIVEVDYNRLPYEVYEFELDLAQIPLLSGVYTSQILMSDSLDEYPSLVYNSEWLSISDIHLRTNVIEYSEADNSGLEADYEGKIRILSTDPYRNLTPGGEQTEYKDALAETIKLKDSPTMEGVMYFQSQPRYMIEKLRLIFAHKNILINGEKWTNIEGLETVNYDHSALKNATIALRRREYEQYNTDNIDIDADRSAILQETGKILQ